MYPCAWTDPLPELVLYGRAGCHLCDEMRAGLEGLRADLDFALRVVDVDTDPALSSRYGRLVPVLTLEGDELCHYFLDREAVLSRLGR